MTVANVTGDSTSDGRNLLKEHEEDLGNPHEVMHDQLTDVTPDQHHPEIHDLDSHSDVTMEPGNLKDGQGLWYKSGQWYNRAAFEESWPTGLADGGELNIGKTSDWNVGDGTRYMDIPNFTIPAGEDFEFSFDWIRTDRTGTDYTRMATADVGDTTDDVRFYDSASTAVDRIAITINGSVRVLGAALAGIAQGEVATYKIVRTVSNNTLEVFINEVSAGSNVSVANSNEFTIGTLFASVNRASVGSAMQNAIIHNTTTGQYVKYKIDEGAGVAILAYDISDQPVPAEDGFSTPDADWQNLSTGPNSIEVIAGLGILSDTYTVPMSPPSVIGIQWGTFNELITAAPAVAGSIVWFSMYDTGNPTIEDIGGTPIHIGGLHQWAQPPGPSLSKQELFLGVAVHNGVEWKEISNPKVINQSAETLREFVTTVSGIARIISGGVVTEEAAFTLAQAEGVVWENNRNWHVDKSDPNRETLPAVSPMMFQYVNRDFTDVGVLTSTVDPAMWDDAGAVSAVGGPANTATVQRVYVDPANNYWILWGQETYPNFLTAQANLFSDVPVVPFILQKSILLGYIISERAKIDWDIDEAIFVGSGSSAGSGGGGTPITDHNNLNGITHSDHHPRLVWEADYTNGPLWTIGTMVANGSYISISNVDTIDFAFPVETGDLFSLYPELPPFAEDSDISQVRSGYTITFTQPGEVRSVEVWVPEVTPDTHFTLVTINDPNGVPSSIRTPLLNDDLTAGAWNTITVGSRLYTIGDEVLVYLESQNFGGTTVVTGGWGYGGQQNTAAPVTSDWNHNNAKTILRIDKTDLDTIDRTAELMGIISGSTVQFAETATPSNSQTYTTTGAPIDQGGTFVEYPVVLANEQGVLATSVVTTMTADVPVAQATKFVFENNKLLVDPTFASLSSFLEYDDVPQIGGADTGYGINFDFQQLSQSPDWDLILLGGGGGGSSVVESGGGNTQTTVDQVAHGFTKGQCIYFDGVNYVLAQANDVDTMAIGMVVEVINADSFQWAITGIYENVAHGYTVGQYYFLSATVAGGVDIDPPSIEQPMLFITGIDEYVVLSYRPSVLNEGGDGLGGDNMIINGDFAIAQRGLDLNVINNYGPDRWYGRTVASAASQLVRMLTQVVAGVDTRLLLATTVADTTRTEISQGVELPLRLIGKTVTLSLEIYVESGYPDLAASFLFLKYRADSMSAWDGTTFATIAFADLAHDDWVSVSATFVVPTFVDFVGISLRVGSGALAASVTVIRYRAVQLEEGPVATPMKYRPIGEELALCQRYYFAADSTYYGHNNNNVATVRGVVINFPTSMRLAPTISLTLNDGAATWVAQSTGINAVRITFSSVSTTAQTIVISDFIADAEL